MNFAVEEVQGQATWAVRLDSCLMSFRCQEEAQAFTERLQARLEAPHELPLNGNERDEAPT